MEQSAGKLGQDLNLEGGTTFQIGEVVVKKQELGTLLRDLLDLDRKHDRGIEFWSGRQ